MKYNNQKLKIGLFYIYFFNNNGCQGVIKHGIIMADLKLIRLVVVVVVGGGVGVEK